MRLCTSARCALCAMNAYFSRAKLYSCATLIGAPLTFVTRSRLSPFGGRRCLPTVGDLFFPYFHFNALYFYFLYPGVHLRSRSKPHSGTGARKTLPPVIPLLLHSSGANAVLEELSRLIGQ